MFKPSEMFNNCFLSTAGELPSSITWGTPLISMMTWPVVTAFGFAEFWGALSSENAGVQSSNHTVTDAKMFNLFMMDFWLKATLVNSKRVRQIQLRAGEWLTFRDACIFIRG